MKAQVTGPLTLGIALTEAGLPAPLAFERAGVQADDVDEVILGQVLTAGCGQNPARQASIRAGLPDTVPAMTVGKVCGSGLKATHLAAQAIKCGDADVIIAGGQENMSATPHLLLGSRDGFRLGDAKLVDSMIVDGLWDVYNNYHMGTTAENIAQKYGITRREQDEFAAASQQKAEAAQKAGRFKDEIVPVEIVGKKGTTTEQSLRYTREGGGRVQKREDLVDPLLDRLQGHEAGDGHRPGGPDAMGPIDGLVLDGRVPPAIE